MTNIVIRLAVAKGEGTRSLENKTTPYNREAENSVVVKEDRTMLLRFFGSQVKMTHLPLLQKNRHVLCPILLRQ